MDVTVSSKYQVVIPRAVRRRLHILPGQKLHVESSADHQSIIISKPEAIDQIIERYAGVARGAWGKDPAMTLRKMREQEWRD